MNLPYRLMTLLFAGSLVSLPCLAVGAENIPSAAKTTTADKATEKPPEKLVTPDATTQGTVDVGGQHIAYSAIAGTLTWARQIYRTCSWMRMASLNPAASLRSNNPKKPKMRLLWRACFTWPT